MKIVTVNSGALGRTVKRLLKERGMSQRELARKAHFDEAALSNWLEGVHVPTLINLVLVAAELGTTVDTLLSGWIEVSEA